MRSQQKRMSLWCSHDERDRSYPRLKLILCSVTCLRRQRSIASHRTQTLHRIIAQMLTPRCGALIIRELREQRSLADLVEKWDVDFFQDSRSLEDEALQTVRIVMDRDQLPPPGS